MMTETEPVSSSIFSVAEALFSAWVVDPISWAIFYDVAFWDNADGDLIQIPLVVAWLVLGALFFTFRFQFVNIRGFRHGIDCVRGRYSTPGETGEISRSHDSQARLKSLRIRVLTWDAFL